MKNFVKITKISYNIFEKRIIMKWIKELLPYAIILIVVIFVRSFIITPIKVNGSYGN